MSKMAAEPRFPHLPPPDAHRIGVGWLQPTRGGASRERGQALIGVLVVMTLVFLLAGAVALGTSGLLGRLRAPDGAVGSDLVSQSATSATVAHVLAGGGCGALTPSPDPSASASPAPSPSVSPTPTPSPTFMISVPAPNGSGSTDEPVYCTGVAQASKSLTSLTPGAGTCSTTDLSSIVGSTGPWWIFFDARWPLGGRAYVAPSGTTCSTSSTPAGAVCRQRVVSSANLVAQVAMECQTAGVPTPTLFLAPRSPNLPPARVFLAQVAGDATAGTYHLAAAATGPQTAGHQAYEEIVLFQPDAAGAAPQLRYEAPLP